MRKHVDMMHHNRNEILFTVALLRRRSLVGGGGVLASCAQDAISHTVIRDPRSIDGAPLSRMLVDGDSRFTPQPR